MLFGTLLQCGISVTASNLTESWLSLLCSLVCKRSSNGRDPTAPSRYATRSTPSRLSPAFIYCLVGGCSSSGVTSHLRHGCHYSSRPKIRLKLWGIWTYFFFTESAILYVFFWVFPRRPIVVCRRFETLYQFHLQGPDVKYEVSVPSSRAGCKVWSIIHTLHPALEDGTNRGFRNVGKPQSDAGEILKRIHTILHVLPLTSDWDRTVGCNVLVPIYTC